MKVYLSPSTQEKNVGTAGYGTEEQRMNKIADIVEKILKENGVEVYRNKPTMTLKEAVADSNRVNPNLHLAIHSNACDGKSRGCEVFCHKLSGEGYEFAQNIYKNLSVITTTPDRGIKQGTDYFGQGKHLYETAYTVAPAALVEVAFHDNIDDAKWIIANMIPIADCLVSAICITLGIKVQKKMSFEDAVKLVSDKYGISFDYWKLRENIDPNFKGFVIKIAKEGV